MLELDRRSLASVGIPSVPRVVEVGGRRGYRFVSSFPAVMERYSRDPSARCFTADRPRVRIYRAEEDAWSALPAVAPGPPAEAAR